MQNTFVAVYGKRVHRTFYSSAILGQEKKSFNSGNVSVGPISKILGTSEVSNYST